MSDEIQEFLRRAAARRAEQMQQLEQQRRAQQQPAAPLPLPYVPQTIAPRPVSQVVEAEIIEVDDLPALNPGRPNVSQQVAQHLDNRGFAQRAERMADATEQADERMEAHLHQAFDHRLGNIGAATQSVTAASPESITAAVTPQYDEVAKVAVRKNHGLLDQLRSPQSVRDAIILGELMRRPEW